MKIQLTKEIKIFLLKALKERVIDIDKLIKMRNDAPARTLTKDEIKEYMHELENTYQVMENKTLTKEAKLLLLKVLQRGYFTKADIDYFSRHYSINNFVVEIIDKTSSIDN